MRPAALLLVVAFVLAGCATASTVPETPGKAHRPRVIVLLCLFASCHVGTPAADEPEDDYEGTPR